MIQTASCGTYAMLKDVHSQIMCCFWYVAGSMRVTSLQQWQPEHLPTDLGYDRKLVKIKRWQLTRLGGQLHDMLGILGDVLADKWHAQQLLYGWPHLQSPPAQHVAFREQSACGVQALTSRLLTILTGGQGILLFEQSIHVQGKKTQFPYLAYYGHVCMAVMTYSWPELQHAVHQCPQAGTVPRWQWRILATQYLEDQRWQALAIESSLESG